LFADLAQTVVGGIAVGCVYGLTALGFVMIYKATEVLNFAQGELMMVAAFAAVAAVSLVGAPFWLAAVLAIAAAALAGAAIDRLLLRPLVGEPVFAIVMATIGLSYLLRSSVSMVPGWGSETLSLDSPFTGKFLRIGGVALSQDHLMAIVATVLACAVLFMFFRYTRTGIAMQAVSQNQLAASFVGVRVKRMFTLVWALSATVAGLAGVLLAPLTFVHVNMGLIGLNALPAAVLGGFGSIPGAIVGGLLVGLAEAFAGRFGPDGSKEIVPHVLLLAVLLVRPQGLFGISLKRRV
jgi:branched-chain amino acid transport system permease protein